VVPDLYTSLAHLRSKLEGKDAATYNLLAVSKEPIEPCEEVYLENFEFIGYDLLDIYGDVSALTNCGGFDNTFLPQDLNKYASISTYEKAYTIKVELIKNNPDSDHANCYVWAIWRIK
jgi:hypothetical protein